MSTVHPPAASGRFDDAGPDFIAMLLAEQQSLSAVEQFCHRDDSVESSTTHTPAQEKYYRKLMPATAPDADHQFAFEVDLDACSGCKACVVACHTLNGLEENESWRRVGVVTSTANMDGAELPIVRHVTTACHHCEDPGCLNGCPVKAYVKDEDTGIVRHLDDQCIGCKYCTMTCPYEVPQYSKRLGIVRKCDMCHQRLKTGEAPACVQSCPNEAIKIRLVPRHRINDSENRLSAGSPRSNITSPTTRYIGADLTDQEISMPQDSDVDQPADNHWPLAVMLVATQISVGIIVVERIGSLFVGPNWTDVTAWACLLAIAVGGAGMGIAPLHLGQPLRAWRVFLGLRTSWLSREAVILGQYMGLLTVALGLAWMPWWQPFAPEVLVSIIPAWAMSVTLWLTAITGVAGLYASAMIYIATRRQLWRFRRTIVRFAGTTIVGGFAGLGSILTGLGFGDAGGGMFATAAITLCAKLIHENRILMRPAKWLTCGSEYARYDVRAQRLVREELGVLANVRLAAGWSGVVLMAIAAAAATISPIIGLAFAGLSCGVLFASELSERLLYFTSVVYDRMPGTLS